MNASQLEVEAYKDDRSEKPQRKRKHERCGMAAQRHSHASGCGPEPLVDSHCTRAHCNRRHAQLQLARQAARQLHKAVEVVVPRVSAAARVASRPVRDEDDPNRHGGVCRWSVVCRSARNACRRCLSRRPTQSSIRVIDGALADEGSKVTEGGRTVCDSSSLDSLYIRPSSAHRGRGGGGVDCDDWDDLAQAEVPPSKVLIAAADAGAGVVRPRPAEPPQGGESACRRRRGSNEKESTHASVSGRARLPAPARHTIDQLNVSGVTGVVVCQTKIDPEKRSQMIETQATGSESHPRWKGPRRNAPRATVTLRTSGMA